MTAYCSHRTFGQHIPMSLSTDPLNFALPIVSSAYTLEGGALDDFARRVGVGDWRALTDGLVYAHEDTGGGFSCLSAELSDGHGLTITNGEAEPPRSVDRFRLSVTDQDGEEVLSAFNDDRQALWGATP